MLLPREVPLSLLPPGYPQPSSRRMTAFYEVTLAWKRRVRRLRRKSSATWVPQGAPQRCSPWAAPLPLAAAAAMLPPEGLPSRRSTASKHGRQVLLVKLGMHEERFLTLTTRYKKSCDSAVPSHVHAHAARSSGQLQQPTCDAIQAHRRRAHQHRAAGLGWAAALSAQPNRRVGGLQRGQLHRLEGLQGGQGRTGKGKRCEQGTSPQAALCAPRLPAPSPHPQQCLPRCCAAARSSPLAGAWPGRLLQPRSGAHGLPRRPCKCSGC